MPLPSNRRSCTSIAYNLASNHKRTKVKRLSLIFYVHYIHWFTSGFTSQTTIFQLYIYMTAHRWAEES